MKTNSSLEKVIFIYLVGVLRRFQHCIGHINRVVFVGRGNQYIPLLKVLYWKLTTIGKQLLTFPPKICGLNKQTSAVRSVLPLHQRVMIICNM